MKTKQRRWCKAVLYISRTILLLGIAAGCSQRNAPEPEPEPEPEPVEVKIAVDKTTIKANGTDVVRFTVTADNKDVTPAALIVRKGEPEDTLGTAGFSTRIPETYTFAASYDGQNSDEVTVEATAVVLSITADRAEFKANNRESVTFTVMADEQDVTSEATIVLAGEPESALDNASYITKTARTCTFYATYDGLTSNEIQIEALPVALVLRADKPSVKADEREFALFSVTADDENVTSSAQIFRKDAAADERLEEAKFATDAPGAYEFYAVYNEDTTQAMQVNFTYVAIPFRRQHLIMQFTGTGCPNCPLMTDAIQRVQQELTSSRTVHHLSLHLNGKHCNSWLAGAIAEIANGMSPEYTFPSAVVDLRDEVALLVLQNQIVTPEYLKKALNRSGSAPAETGMAIESQVNGTAIDFEVKIRATRADNYQFFAFVVEDMIHGGQYIPGGAWNSDYLHANVATYVIPGDPKSGVFLGRIEPGKETVGSFSIETKDINANRKVNLSNCHILAYTLKPSGEGYALDNVVRCPVNGSIRYLYNR
ncbi:MAG: Omp28-related outer membrane protein [Tannerella sp.]|jgi:hypothetical protein|nr:Omp28-related outer membrane protein [Tannerella sp.]